MQVKQLKDEDLNKQFEVTVPSKDIDAKVDIKLKEYGRNVHLKGFRPGKAPLKILRQHYGRRVMGEILEQTVNENTQKLMQEKNIKPARQPKIEVITFDEGQDLVYSVEVEQIPDFELKDVTNIKVEKPVANIRDEEVEKTLENVAKHNKKYVPIEGKRAAKKGDVVKIDFQGQLADGTKYPGMDSTDFDLELGGGQFIPGFEEQLIGKKAGEEAEVKVTFPENYQVGDLAGKDTIFNVTIKEIQKAEEMDISDELAKKVGFDSLDVLKESIRNELQKQYEDMSQMKVKRNLLDILDEQYDFELPEGMVQAEYESIEQQVKKEQHQHSHDHDHDHDHELSDEDKKELNDIARRRVKLGLVLAEIGRENAIEVNNNELQEVIMKEAQKYPGSEQQVVEYYTQNPQALEMVRAPLFEEKVVEHILDLADVKEVVVTPEELAKEDDDEEEEKKESVKTSSKSGAKKKAGSSKKETGAASKSKSSGKKTTAKKSGTKKAASSKK